MKVEQTCGDLRGGRAGTRETGETGESAPLVRKAECAA